MEMNVRLTADDPMIFGWRIRSRRPLPLLPDWDGQDTTSPITVAYGSVPFPGGVPVYSTDHADLHSGGRVVFRPVAGPRILVESGSQIIVEPGGYTDTELQSWLFNMAIASVCHHRGRPPLHGAVVAVGGRAVVLAGNSGNGKSTTTWAMLQRGHRLMSDDLAVIDPETMMVRPAFPSVKLWTAAAPGLSFDPHLRSSPHKDKFFVPVPDRFQTSPLPLGLVIALQKDLGISRPAVHRVPPPIAAAQLQNHVQGRRIGLALDGARTAFDLTVAIARAVPFFVLRRPDDVAGLDDICATIEALAETAQREAGP
ncbi:hypothetical protein GE253_23335 [Niveispirillum sp. SYP-B3756]|uniref:hypothetical protein n=1 Tax=Niveispirillum sp. SYP-B3756 TaxID=2662178 RepID=UPI0012909D75|nr:hypothetical protein [Niveispirillum sp. SYP-B3756]MQP68257.1 hypothetical protein [Niveispirillum sp. SYP-B3756]